MADRRVPLSFRVTVAKRDTIDDLARRRGMDRAAWLDKVTDRAIAGESVALGMASGVQHGAGPLSTLTGPEVVRSAGRLARGDVEPRWKGGRQAKK